MNYSQANGYCWRASRRTTHKGKLGREPQSLVCKFHAILSTEWDMKHPSPTVVGPWKMQLGPFMVRTVITTCLSHTVYSTITYRRDQSGGPQPQRPSNAMIHGLSDRILGLSSHSGGLITGIRARARTHSLLSISYSHGLHIGTS